MRDSQIVQVVGEALEYEGARINLTFDNVTSEKEAEEIISNLSKKVGRTYQLLEHDKVRWFEVVNHDNDKLEINIFLKSQ